MYAWRLGSPSQLIALLAITLVAAIVPFASVLSNLYSAWNLRPEYSHGLLIPALAAYLIWRRRDELRGLPVTGSWWGLSLIGFGLLLRYVGEFSTMHTLEHYALLLVLYGLVLSLVGPLIFRRLWMPLFILVLAIPLPRFIDSALSLDLQLLSSQLGVWVIRAAGISVLLQGNIIDLGNYQLEVAEACSGLRYLFPLMTLAAVLAFFLRIPIWKRVILFLSSVPITVVMNSLRIGLIGITVDRWGPRMAEGVLHEFEGWLIFMFSTAALIMTAWLLTRTGHSRVRWSQAFDLGPAARKPGVAQASSGGGASIVPRSFVAAATLVVANATAAAALPQAHAANPLRAGFDEFPNRIGEWVGRRDALDGVYLDQLKLDDYVLADYYRPDGAVVNLYVAYYQTQGTGRAVHSPRDCIPGGGWEIQSLEQRTFRPSPNGTPFLVNRAVIQLCSSRQLVYYWFQERGRRLTNEQFVRWYMFWDALTRRRTDGALVRFVAPLPAGATTADADSRIAGLAGLVEPQLNRFVPD